MAPSPYREKLRESALSIACRIIEAEGLEAVQARRIAKEADCAVGSLYNVYGDIDGLIVAANSRTLARLGEILNSAAATFPAATTRERLLTLALVYARFAAENHHAWDAVFRHRRADDTPVPAGYLEDQGRLLALIEDVIAPRYPNAPERARVARAMFGAVHGIVSLAVDNRLGGALRAELEAQLSFIVDLIDRGLAPPRR